MVYLGTTSYAWSLIHATPKTDLDGKETSLPSTLVLNAGYLILSGMAVFPLSFAITSGAYADIGEDAKADFYVRAHYLSWSIACSFDISVLVWYAVKLVGILKQNTTNMQANKSKVSDSESYASHVTTSTNAAAKRMKNVIVTLIITALGVGGIVFMFAVLLLCYALLRPQMHAIWGINIWIGILWWFVTPLLELITYIAIYWFTFYGNAVDAGSPSTLSARGTTRIADVESRGADEEKRHISRSVHPE
ncbi:hypothetical protein HDV05_008118 [Chytridiales sp. JEL 0842]|nr:hypothetical protein HDV05_008118 [Chytridiales sp. JEL 0842]